MREMRRRGKVKVLTRDSGAMAAPSSEVAAGGMNKWKVLTAVFVVLTGVLAGGRADVAAPSRGTPGAGASPVRPVIADRGANGTARAPPRGGALHAGGQTD